ncbi:hypothetical protein AKO1_015241 [Acrasis kona]|uniref:Oxidation resistance protein 1 n=1 Tax=Acrasis kona TaxID=1008807 RepID=A0AAW2ZFT2_9EUKA
MFIIKTTDSNVLGFFLPEDIQSFSPNFYGGGDTVIYTFTQSKFKSYKWTRKNEHFIVTAKNHITIGSSSSLTSDQLWALYLDDGLNHGSTYTSDTFDNEPLHHVTDFQIYGIEVWGL